MILCLANVLDTETRERIMGLLAASSYESGAKTAGWHARIVKQNLQAAPDSNTREAANLLVEALKRHTVFRAAVMPRVIRPPLFSRYSESMEYGSHVDDPLMGGNAPVRTDVSMTVFLCDPDSYDGGELVMESTAGEQAYKLEAGAAIVYPSTTLHRVTPVTRGQREVAVTWIQSMVRSPERREILFDIDTARRTLFAREGKSREFDLLSKSHANLMRLWVEV
ncbi:MAG: Fe2+-dependent dioxygenase [Rhodospirillaceae bacterium]|nr:Fe2+-dependent dioxygenase [Rhodospirillaceae bacterium]